MEDTVLRVMVVDDEPTVGRHLQDILESLDMQVAGFAVDADDACRLMAELTPDLVILDAQMPDPATGEDDRMAGIKVIPRLLEIEPVPMIMLTAYDSAELMEAAADRGIGAYLIKPVERTRLQHAISVALARFRDLQWVSQLNQELRQTNEQLAEEIAHRCSIEEALRLSEQKYRTLVENAPDIFLRVDREGTCIYASPNLESRSACKRDEIIGQRLSRLLCAPERRAALDSVVNKVFSTGETAEVEVTHDHIFGERTYSVRLVGESDGHDAPATILGVCRDISDLKAAEAALLRTQQLSAVGSLASGIAHQFNNMHAIILGNADLMLADPQVPDSFVSRLMRIRKTIERASDTIRKLSALATEAHLKEEEILPAQLVQDVVDMIGAELTRDQVELRLDLQATSPVRADRHQFHYVLVNLISNARHAMIGRHERVLTLATRQQDHRVLLQVKDTGSGILPDNLVKVFLPFYSTKGEHASDGSPEASVRGTGLGLSVCEIIIRNHDGKLMLNSTPGVGTTFTISLPSIDSTFPDQPVPTLDLNAQSGGILILDDEPLIRLLLGDVLLEAGYRAMAVDNAETALELLAGDNFSIMLVDLKLPGISGIEFIQRVQQQIPVDARPAIVVISGQIGRTERKILEGLGVEYIMTKPFDVPEVLDLVARLSGQAALAE